MGWLWKRYVKTRRVKPILCWLLCALCIVYMLCHVMTQMSMDFVVTNVITKLESHWRQMVLYMVGVVLHNISLFGQSLLFCSVLVDAWHTCSYPASLP